MSFLKKSFVAAAAFLGIAATAQADLGSLLGQGSSKEQITVEAACGDRNKSTCQIPLAVAAKLPSHITLTLGDKDTGGSMESAARVCVGDKTAAWGQADAFKALAQSEPECANAYAPFGKPMARYLGYLVVRTDNPADSLSALINNRQAKKQPARISGGGERSGGHTTLLALRGASTEWTRGIDIARQSKTEAFGNLNDGTLDALLVMDGVDSPLVDAIKAEVDPKTGKARYKFIEVDPPSSFFRDKKNVYGGFVMYQSDEIKLPGLFSNVDTISVPVMAVFNNKVAKTDAGAGAKNALRDALEQAEGDIRSRTGTSSKWEPQRFGM